MPRERRKWRALAAVWLLAPTLAWAAPADEVKAALEAGRAAEAYAIGKKYRDALGDPAFDFYFGIAAIDTGNAGEGVLALERYLLQFPQNLSARLNLARGYFALGDDARARAEFEELRALTPPADMLATIERFLDAIRLRETRYTVSTGAYVEAGLGIDTNVNGGVGNANIFLPNLGSVLVAPAGTKNGDSFTHLGLGGFVSYPVAPGIALFGNGQFEWKLNGNDTAFDQGTYNVVGGVSVLEQRNLYRFALNHGLVTIENDRFRAATGVSAEWQHQLDQMQAVSLGAQAGRLRYPGTNSPRDADFVGVAAGYRRLFTHEWQPTLTAALSAGREETLAQGREDLARHLYGARIGVSFTPAAKWGASLGYTHQSVRHQARDVILGETRRDKYDAWDAALTYLYTRNLSFRAEALLTKNRSNLQLFTFERDLFTFKIRYEFK